MPWRRSVRGRLTAWYTLWLTVPLAALALLSYGIFAGALVARTDGFLADALTVFQNELMVERRVHPDPAEALATTVREVRFQDLAIVILTPQGKVVAGSGRPPLDWLAVLGAHPIPEPRAFTVETAEGGLRLRLQPLPLGDELFVLAGVYPLQEVEATLRRIRTLFFLLIPLMVSLAAVGGWFLARRSFRPVQAMAARAAEISARTLHERLPVESDDELGDLARVLNGLLDRLEEAFQRQRRFVADASHELRSPAAVLRSEAEVTLSQPHRSEEEYREALGVIREAARRLGKVVDDLFLLARMDEGHPVKMAEALYLDDVVRETARAARPLAEERGVGLEVKEIVEAPLKGDADLLSRLLMNLLDNAVRYAPPGTTVEVSLREGEGGYELEVVDAGPGIPQEAQGQLFQRFFRVEKGRTRAVRSLTGGAGLGLAIGRRIAEMHGGVLHLAESRPGRTVFRLWLPEEGDRG